ncbi:DNA topoisomerase I, partial [Candidatus Woesebacteria bacterium RIFOXYB1_FULL_38_16]
MKLIIVESPTKAKTLARFLGDGYVIEATMGHIKDLPKSKLGVDVENNFLPDFELVEKRSKEIAVLKRQAQKAKEIFIASDPDREGEAIAFHVKEIIGDGKTKRIVFHEITKEAVETAIANPRDIDKALVDAQIARRVLDRLVGYNLSPLLWRKVRRGLSAGRVQTVAVRLIVEREREIQKFKSIEYWEIIVDLKNKHSFSAQLLKLNGKTPILDQKEKTDVVVKELKEADYKISKVTKKETVKTPPPPFTTSTMTQNTTHLFGWSAKRTMMVAQRLYEEGLITYHRTDSVHLSETALGQARSYIEKTFGKAYLPDTPRFYKTKSKNAQEAHEAIRPTQINNLGGELISEQKKLYQLIWNRFLACQMTQAVFDSTAIDVVAEYRKNLYLLRASGQIIKFDGYKKVLPGSSNGEITLPPVEENENLTLVKVNPSQKFTLPPPKFNEASLIKTLEKLGIGRPSTYAPIITTIQIRSYVEKDEGKFTPTTVGNAVTDFLVKYFPDTFEYSFTADMEADLDLVAENKKDWTKIVKQFWTPFDKILKDVTKNAKRVKIEVEKIGKKCPECKEGELVIRVGRFGKFISCSRFPECKFTDKYQDRINVKCP